MEKTTLFRTLLGPDNIQSSIDCLQSVLDHSVEPIRLEIFEDGRLTKDHISLLESSLKNSAVISKKTRDIIVQDKLRDYPKCLHFRNSNVMAFKLFDTILFNNEKFFYIDTDVVFFKKFKLPLLNEEPIFMLDSDNSYSFTPISFSKIKVPIFPKLNAGFMFFPPEKFDLSFIEQALENAVLYNNLNHSWAEQSMWAFLAARSAQVLIFKPQQIVIASSKMKVTSSTVAIHFVKPFRDKIDDYKSVLSTDKSLKEFETVDTVIYRKKLNKYTFTFQWIMHKMRSALRRLGM